MWIMENNEHLNDLRLQFQMLQKQQEKRKMQRKKKNELAGTQDDLNLLNQVTEEDNPESR